MNPVAAAIALFICLAAAAGCTSSDPVERLVAQLDSTHTRERAVDKLLVLVRRAPEKRRTALKERVVTALMEAYRKDEARPQIVSALAILHDPRAEEVFVAALRDARRGGAYFEAAVRSARLLGELGLKRQVPVLVQTLESALAAPRQDHNTWLERSAIQALAHLEDERAVPVLIKALKADPTRIDFYVSRLAARALGRLRAKTAVPALVDALGATAHGLLLTEESRRALCRIGPPAVKTLWTRARHRDRRGHPKAGAAAAVRLLGDVSDSVDVDELSGLLRPGDPAQLRLALAQTLARVGAEQGQALLLELARQQSASLTIRRRAMELLGWYGDRATVGPLLEPSCTPGDAAQQLLCWSAALALCRLGEAPAGAALDAVLAGKVDQATRRNITTYRTRLQVPSQCGADLGCALKLLQGAKDWRVQERAALMLGRSGKAEHAQALAKRLTDAHPQVQRAILVALERLWPALTREQTPALREALQRVATQQGKEVSPHGVTPPALVSRATCLDERLRRRQRERR